MLDGVEGVLQRVGKEEGVPALEEDSRPVFTELDGACLYASLDHFFGSIFVF